MCQLKDQKVAKERASLAVEMRCFRQCYCLLKRTPSTAGSQDGASVALWTGRSDDHTGDELCTDMRMVVSGVLQIYKSTGRKREKKVSNG